MKKQLCVLLALMLALTMTGCGEERESNSAKPDNSVSENNNPAPKSEPDSAPSEERAELTLADGEVRLVYCGGNVLAVVYHGPYKDIGFHFCKADGSDLDEEMFLGYGDMNPGWTMGITYEYDSKYAVSDLGLSVSDYDAERNPDNTYANQSYPIGEQMTDQELANIGLDFLDGRCCVVSNGRGTYGSNNFGLYFSISWFTDGYDREAYTIDIDGFEDKFQLFFGDGTPLANFAPGYTLEVKWRNDNDCTATLWADGDSTKEECHKLVDELKAANPYAVYTNSDGSTVRFDLMTD